MKQVIAIVKPSQAEAVVRELHKLEPAELIVREVKGYGRQRSYLHEYQGVEYTHVFVAKVEISVWVSDELAERAIEVITLSSRTGRLGDGKILVLQALEVNRVEVI
jgi:nitrogen regulatory protein PII